MGKITVNKTYTTSKTYESPKKEGDKLVYGLYDSNGNKVGETLVDPGTDMSNSEFNYYTKGEDGRYQMSEVPKASITLDQDSGNIKIDAPEAVTSTDQWKNMINEAKLKEYSQAYKQNKDYKVQIREKNEETGEEEDKEITIPEYVERLNSGLENYFKNLREQKIYKKQLTQTHGDKVNNMTDAQIVMSAQGAKGAAATYLPDTLLSVGSFGNNIDNPFLKLKNKRGENGEISAEDLKEVWTRSNFGREEVAALMAHINGSLEGSDWNQDTYYTDADGEKHYNRASAEEAAKLIAFKNYVLNNNPEAEWYQQAGDWIESASLNFTYAVTNVFTNLAVMGEGALDMLPGVEANAILDWRNQEDEAMTNYNAISAQAWDALTNAQIWGYLAGAAAGTIASGVLGKAVVRDLKETAAATTVHLNSIAKEMAADLELTGAAAEALTPLTMLNLAENAEAISLGTRLWLTGLTAANKALVATTTALSAINGAKSANILTEYLFDTIHDAIIYDGTTLRNVVEAVSADDSNENRQQVINYWMGQFAENAKFWLPIGVAKGSIKLAGKTSAGKALNAVTTKLVNKIAAGAGDWKQGIKDKIAGGSVVEKLKKDIAEAVEKNQFTKAKRLQNKLDITNWNNLTRRARERLGKLELKWENGKLTDDSLKEFSKYVADVKTLENGIDAYNRNIVTKIDEMTVKQIDPSTGKRLYLNPELGEANAVATMYYWDLVEMNKKYNLSVAKDSMLNQDVVDYWMNSYYKRLADDFASRKGVNAAKAQNASETLQKNINALTETVPEEIRKYIDDMLDRKIYQKWYHTQNEYGMAKGILNRERVMGYENNPIWQEQGYIPIKVQHDTKGKWLSDDGRIDAVIDQDMNQLTFEVGLGQHYADPEMIRQSRLRKMAQAEVNKDLFKAYTGFTNSATNTVMVTGKETAYVEQVSKNAASLDKALDDSTAAFEENFNVEAAAVQRKKPVKNEVVPENTRSMVVASLSSEQTTDFLIQKKVLDGPNAKLTDGVTAENYDEWFDSLTPSAQNYLRQQYSQFGEEIKPIKANNLDVKKMRSRQRRTQKVLEEAISERRSPNNFITLQKAMEAGGDDFESGFQRAYLVGDKSFAKSSIMNEAARNLENGNEAFYQGVVMAKIKGETKNVMKIDTDTFWDDMLPTMQNQLNSYVNGVMSSPGAKAAITALAENANGADAAARYIALNKLKKSGMKKAYAAIEKNIDELKSLGKVANEDVELLKKKAKTLFNDIVDTELDNAAKAAREFSPQLVDSKDIFAKVKELNAKIGDAKSKFDDNYIMYLNQAGQQVYAQVDPAFASLYNTRAKITKADASAMAKFNALTSRAFRYGTTSLNLSAFGNQMFRDFGNAVLVGGSWQTIRTNADNLKDVFGEKIVSQIKAFDPYGYEARQVEKIAAASGQSINEAAVSRELMRGAAIAETTTETSLYKNFMKQAYSSDSDKLLRNAEGKLKQLWEKYDPDKYLNGKRENYLRNRVYASSLNDAMKEGYTLQQARVYAEFAMNNATTNFARQLYHMQAIADSTPYFRAAINGTKSFWRMWSLDPVGISGRIMGGLILPVMFLTGASLGSERDRKVYQNIPEYQKKDSLVFVFNGQAVSIPLPQELSPLVSPFRQFVEYLHGSNQNDFWELMANDLLGFSPYDLTGFTAIDFDSMIEDPTFFDRSSRGFSRLFSQMAPIPVKSAYMIASGTDPYTGKWLRDPSYAYWNDETGSVETMDEYQSTFATWFAKTFPHTNPAIADKVLSGLFGSTGSNLLSDFIANFTKSPGEALQDAGEHLFEQAAKPFKVEQYDLVDAVWKRSVRQLNKEKQDILDNKEFQTINNELTQTKDPEKRKKLLAQRQDYVDNYQNRVASLVSRLTSEYGGSLDRKKYAAVIALLNFNSDAAYQTGSQYSSNLASDQYWDGRDAAIHTMERLGIDGTSDMSIFGYLTTNKAGEVVMKYSSPTAIMDMESQWDNQDDINNANIKALLSENKVYDAHKSVSDQISKIYDSKEKLTDQDYANIEAIQINWNAELSKIIAPYIAKMTPEAAINNSTVLNSLYPYVEVPGSWEVNNKGKHISLGDRGNKKKAYYDSWVKSMFSVNDAYKGQY